MKLLVIGNNTRSIVCSAKRAGYTVYALDNFCDVDMRRCAKKAQLIGGFTDKKIRELADPFGDYDAVILGPGFEKLKFKNTLNNSIKVLEKANDKLDITKKFSSMDIPHPQTGLLTEGSIKKFPVMVKPRFGSGGMRNMIAKTEAELEYLKTRKDASEFIVQEFVNGISCSASLICTRDDAVVVALNEQLIGTPWLTRLPFAYCGNITPFHNDFREEMIEYARQIAFEFGLLGSNGVDFVLTEKGMVAIEVNPRFQGSIDTVELSTGINIFDAHIRSFAGELPEPRGHICFAGKAIMYSNKKFVVNQRLSKSLIKCMHKNRVADVPENGWVIQADEPIASIIETGKTREKVFEKIQQSNQYIKSMSEV
jgi:predicted ATP-grasp superfamily ATP-dependent carboligase